MKGLTRPSRFLLLVLLRISVTASILLFDIGVSCRNVFVSTFMLTVRSNPAVAYVVFNFISVMIFLGFLRSLKPLTSGDIDEIFFLPPLLENTTMKSSTDDEDDEYHGYDGYEEDNDDDMEEEEDEDSEAEEGGSDLEKRSEEFIAKMNSKWREELLHERLLCMVYASAPKLELL
ncbi:hypothetical protein ACJRO7_020183 [Eucalyptus globulus]|uniref:Uncharacterized protein n=1 Tax=Eucalyptus globulus TaxID=34317 RepID=A0ABD3KHE7_EUCGL